MDGSERMCRRRGITPELQQAAWQLRNQMTPAEEVLWEALRERRLNGLRFRRQHPVGQFILDFIVHSRNWWSSLTAGSMMPSGNKTPPGRFI